MSAFTFLKQTNMHPALLELFNQKTHDIEMPTLLKKEGVIFSQDFMKVFLPYQKIEIQEKFCRAEIPTVDFLDSDALSGTGFSKDEFWLVASVVITKFLAGKYQNYIDKYPLFGVVMYVKSGGENQFLPVNMYREEAPECVLRIRTFPYNTSKWDQGTMYFVP